MAIAPIKLLTIGHDIGKFWSQVWEKREWWVKSTVIWSEVQAARREAGHEFRHIHAVSSLIIRPWISCFTSWSFSFMQKKDNKIILLHGVLRIKLESTQITSAIIFVIIINLVFGWYTENKAIIYQWITCFCWTEETQWNIVGRRKWILCQWHSVLHATQKQWSTQLHL